MEVIIGICICFLVLIIFTIYIIRVIKQSKKSDTEEKPSTEIFGEIKTDFETLKCNAEIIDMNCRVEMVGIKQPKAVTFFTVCFETDNNEKITIDVPQEMYDGLEKGQKGELTLIEGELYSFII